MDPSLPAVLTIDSGDVVQYPDTWYMWGNEPQFGMSFEDREPLRRKYSQGPYSMPGPVAIRGAQPGDVIECRMLKLRQPRRCANVGVEKRDRLDQRGDAAFGAGRLCALQHCRELSGNPVRAPARHGVLVRSGKDRAWNVAQDRFCS
jgi:hypothetical protein